MRMSPNTVSFRVPTQQRLVVKPPIVSNLKKKEVSVKTGTPKQSSDITQVIRKLEAEVQNRLSPRLNASYVQYKNGSEL